MDVIFATGNAGKIREAGQICDALGRQYGVEMTVVPMPEKADIAETGSTYRENSFQKADFVWKRWHTPCIADDSGLEVEELGGEPGIFTARYCDRNFSDGIDKLLYELSRRGALSPERRRASFECCITLVIDGHPHFFEGHCPGTISLERCGVAGFGFDPVFIADATPGLCMAQLPEDRKNMISHRGLAFDSMFRWLADNKCNRI